MRRKRRLQEEEGRREGVGWDREGCEVLSRAGGRQRKQKGEGWVLGLQGNKAAGEKRESIIPHEPQGG